MTFPNSGYIETEDYRYGPSIYNYYYTTTGTHTFSVNPSSGLAGGMFTNHSSLVLTVTATNVDPLASSITFNPGDYFVYGPLNGSSPGVIVVNWHT